MQIDFFFFFGVCRSSPWGKSLRQNRVELKKEISRRCQTSSNLYFNSKKVVLNPPIDFSPATQWGFRQSHKSTRKKLSFHSRHIFGMPGGWRWCVWVRQAARTVRKGHEGSKIYGKWCWKDFLWLYTGWMVTKFMHISLTLLAGKQNGGRGLKMIAFHCQPWTETKKREWVVTIECVA